MEYISIDEVIAQSKKEKIDLGKGDPYNRLRYYTKIGWIPNMKRMKDKDGAVTGHYPKTIMARLSLIQQLKAEDMTNEDITEYIAKVEQKNNVHRILQSKELRVKIFAGIGMLMLFVIFLSELEIIKIGRAKSQLIYQNTDTTQQVQIMDSGSAYVPKEQNKVFVKTSSVFEGAKIYVSFKNDYSPATKFWISEQTAGEGFSVELDAPVLNDSEFDWWITF